MSMFKVSIEKIGSVENHPNADRLDIVKVDGKDFDIITGRDSYKVGDPVLFFPVDSVMPIELSEKLEITKNLKNGRIKTIKLRGMFSQGFVVAVNEILESGWSETYGEGDDVKELLGVTKYEIPEFAPKGLKTDSQRPGHLRPLPEGVVKYDLEGAQNYTKVVDQLMDQKVYISEKMEGSHWGCTIDIDGNIQVFQRNFSIDEAADVPHAWWEVFRKEGYAQKLMEMMELFSDLSRITIRGEIVGPSIQSNYYDLDKQTVYVFEIEFNDKPIDAGRFANVADVFGLKIVPTLGYDVVLKDWLNGRSVTEASDGLSVHGKPREGIVIKPMVEQFSRELGGRMVLKQRGPEYLADSGN